MKNRQNLDVEREDRVHEKISVALHQWATLFLLTFTVKTTQELKKRLKRQILENDLELLHQISRHECQLEQRPGISGQ